MWRTEEVGAYKVVGTLHIVNICLGNMLEASKMMIGMIAHLMALRNNTSVEVGILAHIVSYHEESGVYPKLFQCLQNERRRLRYRSVVKREIYRTFVAVHSPGCTWKQPTQPY